MLSRGCRRVTSFVVVRVLFEGNQDFTFKPHRLHVMKSLCLLSDLKVIFKGFKCLEDVIYRQWILFDFHYLNSLPLERGPFPSINN